MYIYIYIYVCLLREERGGDGRALAVVRGAPQGLPGQRQHGPGADSAGLEDHGDRVEDRVDPRAVAPRNRL